MIDALVPLVTLLMWVTVAAKGMDLRRDPNNNALRALWLAYLQFALALTLFNPAVYASVGRLVDVSNVAEPLARVLVLAAGCAAQAMLLHLTQAPPQVGIEARRRVAVLVPAACLMVLLFVLAPVERGTQRFTSEYGDEPLVAAYLSVFLVYLAYALIDVMRLCWRFAPLADRELLGSGLRVVAAGCLVGLLYVALKLTYLALLMGGAPGDGEAESALARVLALTGLTLIILGTTLPAWGPRLRPAAFRHWWCSYRTHRRLYPLWRLVYEATPEIALDPPRSWLPDALRLNDLDYRLHRRVIEIHDGQLALRPFVPLEALDSGPEGADPTDAPALVARLLLAGRDTKAAGASDALGGGSTLLIEADDLADELAWWTSVARELERVTDEQSLTAAQDRVERERRPR